MTRGKPRLSTVALAATVVAATFVTAPHPGAASPTLPADELAQVGAAMRAAGLRYGMVVDPSDVKRFADHLGVGVGEVVDPPDLTRVLAAAGSRARHPAPSAPRSSASAQQLATLAPAFAPLGLRYGTTVDAGDVFVLARRLGVRVGAVIDPPDVEQLQAAAGAWLGERYPSFGTVGGVTLHLPAAGPAIVAYHQANHDGAQGIAPTASPVRTITLPSRARPTHRRSAADIPAPRGTPVLAPVTGRVKRAGSYVLYCRYRDDYAVIEPDGRPGWELKVLHVEGLAVRRGERVVAGETLLAAGPRAFPFRSQVDDYTPGGPQPHVHLEMVDTSIPDIPSPGGSC